MDKRESLYTRTEMLLGPDGIERLKGASVAVFGVGGVGGFCAEALARAGVGKITLIDSDRVSVSNLNRQIIALHSTVGKYKTEVMAERILDVNPECEVKIISEFYSEENPLPLGEFDYIADCIDSVKSKIYLIESALRAGVPVISSMGAGNKLDPTRFRVADISKTHTDPLAKVIRTELRKRGITKLKVVFSDEVPIKAEGERLPGSVSFVPSVVGLVIGGEIVKDIAKPRTPLEN